MIGLVEEAAAGIGKSNRQFWQARKQRGHIGKLTGICRIFRFVTAGRG